MACWLVLLSGAEFSLTLHEVLGRAAYLLAVTLLVLFAIVLGFVRTREVYGDADTVSRERRINCPSCGARTPIDQETCEYCDEPIHR